MINRHEGKLVFTFPGQGAFNADMLRVLFESGAWKTEFEQARQVSRSILGHDFVALVETRSEEERQRILAACPDLDQLGIYVGDYLTAAGLIAAGLRPDLVLGHSLGELAALAIAGCYTFETGLRIVCQRSAVLTLLASGGRMGALSCNAERALELIRGLNGARLEVAVINHKRQTVISGLPSELDRLRDAAASQGVSLTLLKSRHPFHSSMLRPVVEPFRLMLTGHAFESASMPAYLCTEGRLLAAGDNLASILSEQFIRQLDFAGILVELHARGYRRFVECGAGNIVTRVTLEAGLDGVKAFAAAPIAEGPEKGRAAILEQFSEEIVDGNQAGGAELTGLIREMRDVLEKATRKLELLAPVAAVSSDALPVKVAEPAAVQTPAAATSPEPFVEPEPVAEPEPCDADPIAIVAMGCVLPGAQSPQQYWSNILAGFSGITDLGDEDPTSALDFLGGSAGPEQKIISDKTYTQLSGYAGAILYDAALLSSSYSREQFERLTRAEKLLAMSSAQAFSGMLRTKLAAIPADRIECVLGATADGSNEYDCAVFEQSMEGTLAQVEGDAERRAAFSKSMRRIWGEPAADNPRSPQSDSCRAVIESTAGRPIRTYVIDAACSSSLYAIGLGVTALQDRTKDMMLVGGVFAPAQANSALFAQFRGLSPNASRPFDASADGVIFGEGSGLLVLKRLSDAMATGDRILGVVRGVGVSSDGKSPAINVPQSKGQSLAIRRAYDSTHIDVDTIQYVEAHATATPVGDAVEFGALQRAITRNPELPRIELGSVKALIGHTGWAAGVASVIKLCKAFENRTIPPQYNYSSPNPQINLDASPFHISTSASAWPQNAGRPRRAAINGFGFGGTNAHLILEEFHPGFHAKLTASVKPKAAASPTLAVIDAAALFPTANGFEKSAANAQQAFARAALRLPKGQRLLPDVMEHMDSSQYLALLAAEQLLPSLGEKLKELRDETGIVIGVESKTDRGIRANQRIFLDRLKRKFAEDTVADGMAPMERRALLDRVCAAVLKDVIPSGPYTLPGLMPNVISGRVANMFELHGPNVVIDMGSNSLFQSLMVARDFLMHGECKAVLAGGLNAVSVAPSDAEAAFLMVLTTEATAREMNLPVACLLSLNGAAQTKAAAASGPQYHGAQGTIEVSAAIAAVREGRREIVVREQQSDSSLARELVFKNARPEEKTAQAPAAAVAPASGTYAYVQNTPIYYYTPVETAAQIPQSSTAKSARRILFLTDQPAHWRQLEKNGAIEGFDYHVISAHPSSLARSTSIDLADEEAVKSALATLPAGFDTVIAVKFSGEGLPDTLLSTPLENVLGLPDLAFAVCRHYYEQFQAGTMAMGSLCMGAYVDGKLNPFSGLLAGFVKSLARELPAAICRSVNLDELDFRSGMARLDAELSHRGKAVEVCYRGGNRSVIELSRMERPSDDSAPLLNSDSVVLATGGGRGVTAVLTEELLTRFGCTVVALGRTNPALAPAHILRMTAAELAAYEQEFYKTELAKGGVKITELKNRFRSYQAAQEVNELIQQLSALPGKFEYISCDITNGEVTTAIVEQVFRKYGRLDMVLHGAGIQISKVLTRKTVGDFHSVVAAKIASLQHIYQACEKHRGGRAVHYHLLTSAFSYMGNDGQPDYGAVNESLNRLADVMAAAPEARKAGSQWCSVAWLGWAGIGMTRGSEFAALAASRGLRGITRSEGREIFSHYLTGQATAPINILMADGELKFYDVATAPGVYKPAPRATAPANERRQKLAVERTVTADGAPYILNHCVDGIPTLPGAFLIMMFAEAALELRPELKITAFEDAAFRKFVRLRSDGPTRLRLNASVVCETDESTLIRVEAVSDFVHKSGKVLQKDVVQTEMSVRMRPALNCANTQSNNGHHSTEGRLLSDPYVMQGSPVHLNGPFRTLNNIVVGEKNRTADYRMSEFSAIGPGGQAFLSSLMVMDSLWRFGAIDMFADNTLPVYVPEACRVMNVYFDLGSPGAASTLSDALSMTGSNPTVDQDRLTIGPVEVRDQVGSVLLTVDGGVCRRMGEVRNGHH